MSLTPWLPTVRKIRDGESVEQAVVNIPIEQLAQRDQHLYDKFSEIAGKSVLITVEQPLHPSELFVANQLQIVYYKKTQDGAAGLAKAYSGFSSDSYSSFFKPGNSSYVFGILKDINHSNKTGDVYLEGLCELDIMLDDPERGLIQKTSGIVEPFEVGPYYLSANNPGKITKNPAGIPVYVGYALSRNKFLLHTSTDEFSQFFINYRFHLLDRVAGLAVKTLSTWSISSQDLTKLGWVMAEGMQGKPENAVFYYNIPDQSIVNNDSSLEAFEKAEAVELQKQLPPVPANFVQFYTNGILTKYRDFYDPDGLYSINEYGLWWYKNSNGSQPWSSDYPTSTAPSNWTTTIKPALATSSSRKDLFISFSKFNPILRTQLVSSLKPFNAANSDLSSNFIQFFNSDNLTNPASTGDLYVSVNPQFTRFGYTNTEVENYPAQSPSYTIGKALADLKYSKPTGKFHALYTPVVSKLVGINGISVAENPEGTGIWNISYGSQSITGQVDSIEPINARLEFIGLTSYLKLPYPGTTPFGYIGKIVLPAYAVQNKNLYIRLHVFGDTNVAENANNRRFGIRFQYSSAAAVNIAGERLNTLVTPTMYTANDISAYISPDTTAAYAAFTVVKLEIPTLLVPAEHVQQDAVVNFKITRISTDTPSQDYLGAIGVVATYWEIIP